MTERGHAEPIATLHAAAKTSQGRSGTALGRALDAGGIGLWSWDIGRDIVSWDAGMERIVGGRPTKASEYVDFIVPDDRERVWAHIQRALETGAYDEQEYRFRRPNGETCWVMCKGQVEREADGRPSRILGATIDITERRLRQEQMLTLHRLESVGRLAGGIAHDFNNMLTVILGCAKIAETKLPDEAASAESVRADLAALRVAAERAAELTAQLLAFAGRQVQQPSRQDLNELLRQAQGRLAALLPASIQLQLGLGATQCVQVDPTQLECVLSNLVANARDAMPDGGTLTITTSDLERGGAVRVDVADTGTGIRAEHLPRIFDPFFTTQPPGVGRGLGLATCFGIVEQSGGTLTVDTAVGVGSTFHVDLRACTAAQEVARLPANQPKAEHPETATVLVVEDEAIVRKMSVRSLELFGYCVLAASSGAEALGILRTSAVDLVVSDLMMPHMTGRELATLIREAWPRLPILFVSGYSEETLDGFELLPKPFTPSMLGERVRHLLAER